MLSTCCYARHGRYKIYHTIWWNLRFLKLLSTDTWHRCFWGIITVSSQDHDLTFTNSSRTFSKTRISNWQKLTVLPSLVFHKELLMANNCGSKIPSHEVNKAGSQVKVKSKWSRKVKHWNSQGGLRDWDSNAPAQLVMMDFNGEHHTISFTRLVSCPCLMPVPLVRICPDVHHSDENNHVWCWLYLTLHLVLAPSRHSSPSNVVSRTG